jgi:tetratricopeptide (TPR) repeat protein
MKTLSSRTTHLSAASTRKLIKLERRGRYPEALELLTASWTMPGELPDLASMPPVEAAHLQLRYGALVGFDGHSRNVSGAQGRSKDLLTNALDIFSSLGDEERSAECENFIGLAYWRTGEYQEADAWVEQALTRPLPAQSEVRLFSHIVKSLVLMDTKHHEENAAYCAALEETFRLQGDPFLNGCFCSNLGLSLKDLGRTHEALATLDMARAFHERSGHRPYLGTVSNNLALLYKDVGRYHMAHFSVDKAISIYKRIGDKAREGSSCETKAQIFLAEGRLGLAHTTIDRAIAILRKSENLAYLAEAILMRSKVYLAQGSFEDAVLALIEAVDITRNQTGENAAKEIISEFKRSLEAGPLCKKVEQKTGEIELLLPPEIAGREDYKGVWIHNSYLTALGISRGTLVLVVNEQVSRGEPAAVLHTASGEVSCGFYDADFGIVALEGDDDSEPQLFAQEDIKILGKIVAVCENDAAGSKMTVRPISC